MGKMPWAVFLWPGLPFLYRGQTLGLVVAVATALLLNLALVASFVWIELLGSGVRVALWLGLALGWAMAAWWGWRVLRDATPSPEPPEDQGFALALHHYLRGDWFEAERLLVGLLTRDEEDVESRLLLATLLRHRKRYDEALRHLEFLQGIEAAAAWHWEICRERQFVAEAESRNETDPCPATDITTEAEHSEFPEPPRETQRIGSRAAGNSGALENATNACSDRSEEWDRSGGSEDDFGDDCDSDDAVAGNRWGPSPKSLRVA